MSIPIHRRVLYTSFVLALFLVLLEAVLAVAPALLTPSEDTLGDAEVELVCVGDSVTAGSGVSHEQTWPSILAAQLGERGVERVHVSNISDLGAGGGILHGRAQPAISHLSSDSRPLVLVMLGHNDFVWWGEEGAKGIRGRLRDNAGRMQSGDLPSWQPRILRVLRWSLGTARREVPIEHLDASLLAMFEQDLRDTRDLVLGHGGSMYLLTYLVPGEPTPDMDSYAAQVIAATHRGQPAVNGTLRNIAHRQEIPLIDLEAIARTPPSWDPAWFVDHIHLNEHGAGVVATAVRRYLALAGELPATSLAE